jgi:uncharacterized protein YjbJ (UPF0337 family)
MNKNQAEGSADQVKGAVKEAVGRLVGDKRVEAEGKKDQAAGKLQEQIGDVVEVLSNVLKKV